MRATRVTKYIFLLLMAIARHGFAQSDLGPVYSAWWSGGWNAPVADNSNIGHDRTLMVAGFERRFRIVAGGFGTLSWAPAILPAVNATNNRRFEPHSCGRRSTVTVVTIGGQCYSSEPYSAFGLGVLPLAFQWQTSPARRLGLIANLDGGGVWFDHRLPVSASTDLNGTRFNFTARAGLDAVVRVTSRTWVSAGYRHLHLSNGGFGSINPGIDAPLLALGVAWR